MPHRRSIILTLLFILLCAGPNNNAFGQSAPKESAKLRENKEKLAKLIAEKKAFEEKLNESSVKEQSTLDRSESLERHVNQMRRSIRKLREQEQDLAGDIQSARSTIGDLEQQLGALKTQYAGYVRSVYKYGRVYDVELLFSSRSINQLYIRMEYLKRFTEQRAKDLAEVVHKKTDLEAQNEQLQASLEHERKLLSEKTAEESSLNQKVSEHQKVLAAVRRDKRKYQEALKQQAKSERELNKIIADLVEKDAARERRLAATPTPAPDFSATGAFGSQKGRLRWPVSSGTIASRFGNQVHPVLKTVRENTGIDIGVKSGSNVQAVADGHVSIVTFIPGLGNIVILTHSGGYRTIYAQLSEVSVAADQKVKAGDVIAKSGDSVDGSVLHFELWKDREKQNPELWLAKQR
jgi:septal ring factor EnvC (AmiA/AmiB activator)